MSNPYVYTPASRPANIPYIPTSYNYPPSQQGSPFIPNLSLYHTSPYSNPSSLPGSPYNYNHNLPNTPDYVPFPGADYDPHAASWGIPPRQRRPSWHGAVPGQPSTPYLRAPDVPIGYRRHSFGSHSPYQPPPVQQGWSQYQTPGQLSPWSNLYPPLPDTRVLIHPFLDGESPRRDFLFDLSSNVFSPMRHVGPGQTIPISDQELREPATHPPITRLRIVCDLIPQWPLIMEYNPQQDGQTIANAGFPPPILLVDILVALHRHLHQRISHTDWAKLSISEETAVARAYTRRCRSSPSLEALQRNQGVKRIDFFLDRFTFRGLVRTGDGWDELRLIVA
ncbi:hypothetical protein BD779DRAFT_1154796 [Infundibulicybe gibba]|nr:hypothetical protein BD779DRAFT_1154796 [Infundibulicybe gibba]